MSEPTNHHEKVHPAAVANDTQTFLQSRDNSISASTWQRTSQRPHNTIALTREKTNERVDCSQSLCDVGVTWNGAWPEYQIHEIWELLQSILLTFSFYRVYVYLPAFAQYTHCSQADGAYGAEIFGAVSAMLEPLPRKQH